MLWKNEIILPILRYLFNIILPSRNYNNIYLFQYNTATAFTDVAVDLYDKNQDKLKVYLFTLRIILFVSFLQGYTLSEEGRLIK